MTRIKDLPTLETLDPTNWIAVDSNDDLEPSGKASPATLAAFVNSDLAPVLELNAGAGISISGDPQNPIISSTGSGVGDMLSEIYDPQDISSDAFSRGNHTGEQPISATTGLQDALDGKIEGPITIDDTDGTYARITFDTLSQGFTGVLDTPNGPLELSYSPGEGNLVVTPGQRILMEGFPYNVAESDATGDGIIDLPGGVKLHVLVTQIGRVNAVQFGVFADDNTTNETTKLQAALNYAGTIGGFNRGVVVVNPGQRVVLSSVTIPTNVTLEMNSAYLNVTSPNSIRMNNGSVLMGIGGRIQALNVFSGAVIAAADPLSATSLIQVIGVQLNGANNQADPNWGNYVGINISSFYQCNIDPIDIRGFGRAYFQSGDVQCYYNKITVNLSQCSRGFFSIGPLCNGNTLYIRRCQTYATAIEIREGTGNTINLGYIDGNYVGAGILLLNCRGTYISGGLIELPVGGTKIIQLSGVCNSTTIVGIEHGGPGSFADWIQVGGTSTRTTILGRHGQYFNVDGAVTSYDGNLHSTNTYNNENPSAANVYIGTDGEFYRSSSALKYKDGLQPITDDQISAYMSLSGFSYHGKGGDPSRRFFGMAADHALEAGLPELVDFGKDGEPEGYHYGRDVAILLEVVKRLDKRVSELEFQTIDIFSNHNE